MTGIWSTGAVASFAHQPKYNSAVIRSTLRCAESSPSPTSHAPWIEAAAARRLGIAWAMAMAQRPLMQKPTAPHAPSRAAGSPAAKSSMVVASDTMPDAVIASISSRRACMSSSLEPNSRNGPPR